MNNNTVVASLTILYLKKKVDKPFYFSCSVLKKYCLYMKFIFKNLLMHKNNFGQSFDLKIGISL